MSITIAPAQTFVPAKRGLNQDPRVLSLLLTRVEIANSADSAVYVDGKQLGTAGQARARTVLNGALLLAGLALSIILIFRRTRYAWIALLVSAPFSFAFPVYGTTITLSKVVLLASIISLAVRQKLARNCDRTILPVFAALAFFVLEMLISAFVANAKAASIRETLKILEYAIVLAVAYAAYREDGRESTLRLVVSGLLFSVSALALVAAYGPDHQSTTWHGLAIPRVAGPLEGPNQLGAFLGTLLIVVLSRGRNALTRFDWVAVAVGAIALLLTFSRGGVIAATFGLFVLAALRFWPSRASIIVAGASGICIALFVLTFYVAQHSDTAIAGLFGVSGAFNGGLGSRPDLWHSAILFFREHPLLGIGPGNFELRVGTLVPGVRTHANNYYLNVLAEQGLIGFIAFLPVVVVPVSIFIKRASIPLCAAGMAVVLSMALHQSLDSLLIYPKVGLVYWLLLAVSTAASRYEAQQASTENA